MNSTGNRKESRKQVAESSTAEATKAETNLNPTANDEAAVAEREKAEELQAAAAENTPEFPDPNLESTKEEQRRAHELALRDAVAEQEAKDAEEKKANATSTASEEQYSKRLTELEAASVDMSAPYNARFEARQKADALRAVIADLKGEGDPAGETVAREDRPNV